MGECRMIKCVFPRVLSNEEHARMKKLIDKGFLPFEKETDSNLIDCGLIERTTDLEFVVPRDTDNGSDFYYEPDTNIVNFFWLADNEWSEHDEEL